MSDMERHLERLLKAAACAPPLPSDKPSPALKARVLQQWRRALAQPSWGESFGMLGWGLCCVSLMAVVTVCIALVAVKVSALDEWSLANTMARVPWSILR